MIQKRKKVDSHELQTLRNVVKKGEEEVIKNFEDAFKEVRIEGKRKKASVVNYTESSLSSSTGSSLTPSKNPKETLYMGTNSEARQRYHRSRSDQRRSQSRDSRYRTPLKQSRYDGFKS